MFKGKGFCIEKQKRFSIFLSLQPFSLSILDSNCNYQQYIKILFLNSVAI